ncbi:hypothetical protein OAB00_03340 [Akkermansiaceae bacterium]|jgi:hypothetical protein|nr:hypothetical protein [Akkermansiaceae bacterium]|tara:strand:- start:894 stop:1589 length:696 start_codon:yes stop_codon:yes gene_type:complete
MATSGTTSFNLTIEEVIDEAFNRCGVRPNSGNDLRKARRNLNVLFSDWGNRGVHLWKVELDEIALVAGQAEYTCNSDVSDVLEAFVSTTGGGNDTANTQDVSLTKVDRSNYAALPNKLNQGQPSQYYVDRQTTPKIYLYQAPDASTYTYVKFYVVKRIEDAGAYSNNPDAVFRFLPCMIAGLAYYLSFQYAADRVPLLKQTYEDEMIRALDEDGQRTSLYVSPMTYFGDGV